MYRVFIMKKSLKILLTTAIVNVFPGSVVSAAPAISDQQKDVQKQFTDNKNSVYVSSVTPAADKAEGIETFHLKRLNVSSEIQFKDSNKGLQIILDKYKNSEVSLLDLQNAVLEVTSYFRKHGYPAATAYLPPQKSEDGTILIAVETGKFGEITIENHSRLKTSVIESLIKGLKKGDIIQEKKLNTALYNIIGLGGVKAGGMLQPGKEVGESDLVVRVEDGDKESFVLYTENYGSKSSGRYRYGFTANLYEMAGKGDHFGANVLISNNKQRNYGIQYDQLIGRSGTKAGIALGQTYYELGGHFNALGATGRANTVSLYGTTPLWNTGTSSMNITYGWDYRKMKDELRSFDYEVEKHSHAFHVGVNGHEQFAKNAVNYDITTYIGNLTGENAHIGPIPLTVAPEGKFSKIVANLSSIQKFSKDWDLMLRFQGQKAGNNLDSSEQMYLGGANAVRAYPQGEGSGDEGYQATAELRYHTKIPGVTLSTYFDIGHVKYTHNDSIPGGTTLKGWGVGVSWNSPNNLFARLDYARRIGLADDATDDAKSKQRMWFMLGKVF